MAQLADIELAVVSELLNDGCCEQEEFFCAEPHSLDGQSRQSFHR